MTDIEKRRRNLSQEQIDRKKHIGANLTRATSIIGLGSAAAIGGSAIAPRLARAGKLGRVTEKEALKFKSKTQNKLLGASVIAGGIGGYNGFNNASWQAAEARQKKKSAAKVTPMAKSYEEIEKFEMPTGVLKPLNSARAGFRRGIMGKDPVKAMSNKSQLYTGAHKVGSGLRQAGQYGRKNWKPLAIGAGVGGTAAYGMSKRYDGNLYGDATGMDAFMGEDSEITKRDFDPEERRGKRNDRYQNAAYAGAGAAGAGAIHQGVKGTKKYRKLARDAKLKELEPVLAHGGKAAGLAALSGGAVYAGHKISQKKKDEWSPFGKSAFGVEHD